MSKIREHININTDLRQVVGDKNYELSNLPTTFGIGNVLQVVTDRKLAIDSGDYNPESGTYYTMILGGDGVVDCYVSDVVSQSDYYPFGMMLPGRNSSEDSYRYGFQGQEMDDEIKGEGNSANYKYRMHDPRVGRFFCVDPLAHDYPWYTPYSFSGNKVVAFIELEGKEELSVNVHIVSYNKDTKISTRTSVGIHYDFNTNVVTIQMDYTSNNIEKEGATKQFSTSVSYNAQTGKVNLSAPSTDLVSQESQFYDVEVNSNLIDLTEKVYENIPKAMDPIDKAFKATGTAYPGFNVFDVVESALDDLNGAGVSIFIDVDQSGQITHKSVINAEGTTKVEQYRTLIAGLVTYTNNSTIGSETTNTTYTVIYKHQDKMTADLVPPLAINTTNDQDSNDPNKFIPELVPIAPEP